MTTQIVLVPGFWLGAWAWDDVAPLLADRGYVVTALTLPGLEPDDSGRGDVTLDDHAEAIAAALDRGADRRVLVVHSGAALPGTMVLDRHPGLVDHVVFVDTAPVRDGFAMNAELQEREFPLSAAWDSEMAGGSMRDLTDEQLSTFRERAVPQPGHTVSDPVVLSDPARLAVPALSSALLSRARSIAPMLNRGWDFSPDCWITPRSFSSFCRRVTGRCGRGRSNSPS